MRQIVTSPLRRRVPIVEACEPRRHFSGAGVMASQGAVRPESVSARRSSIVRLARVALQPPALSAGFDTGVSSTDNLTRIDRPQFEGIAPPDATLDLLVDGQVVARLDADAKGRWQRQLDEPLADGTRQVTVRLVEESGGAGPQSPALSITLDTQPPRATAGAFFFQSAPHLVRLNFSEDVGASIAFSDVGLTNHSTSDRLDPALLNVAFSELQQVLNVSPIGLPGQIFGDGDWTLRLDADAVEDRAGNTMTEDAAFDFFFLQADANRDRRVDLLDYQILVANLGNFAPAFSLGDFDYDGFVTIDDFYILQSNWNVTLPPRRPDAADSVIADL